MVKRRVKNGAEIMTAPRGWTGDRTEHPTSTACRSASPAASGLLRSGAAFHGSFVVPDNHAHPPAPCAGTALDYAVVDLGARVAQVYAQPTSGPSDRKALSAKQLAQ